MNTLVAIWAIGTAITSSTAGLWWLIWGRKRDRT